MNTEPEKRIKTSSKTVSIAPSKIFTYPTRLANCFHPEIMEINLPEFKIEGSEIEVVVRYGSTSSLDINPGRIYKKIYKKIASPIEMNDEYIHDARYEIDGNIAHILGNVIPRLLIAKAICSNSNIIVILRRRACNMAKNVYKMFGFPTLCTDKDVLGKLVIVKSHNPSNVHVLEEFIGLHEIFGSLVFEGLKSNSPDRVFISRKRTRCLLNENEVEQTLRYYDFEKFYFEDIPISDQWSIIKNAKVIVGVHGAGLAGIIFNTNTPKVVELMHPGYTGWAYRPRVDAIGGKYCGVTGQIKPNVIRELDFRNKTGRRFALSSMKIDTTSLRMALEYLEVKQESPLFCTSI